MVHLAGGEKGGELVLGKGQGFPAVVSPDLEANTVKLRRREIEQFFLQLEVAED